MTAVKRYNDTEQEVIPIRNGNGAVRSILIAVICAFIVGMGGYIFNRGINTNIAVASVEKDVAVLKECVSTMKTDIADIKDLSREIRLDQIRRQKAGK